MSELRMRRSSTSHGAGRSAVPRVLVVALLAVLVGLGGTGTALAHNQLIDSTPEDGAQVESGPDEVRLTYDQPVREGYNTVNVIGPDGSYWTDDEVRVEGNEVVAPVRDLGPAGTYTVGYRILSNDGHPVTGKVTFDLTQEGNGTPAPPPEEATEEDSGDIPVWPWVAGAVVLALVGLGLALRLGRPKS